MRWSTRSGARGGVLFKGGAVAQETRLWDPDAEVTRSMRSKESAHDYRYFPDPDLLPLEIHDAWIEEIRATLPELAQDRQNRFMKAYGLSAYDADILTQRRDVADYFEAAVQAHANPKAIANWLMGDLFRVLKERKLDAALRIEHWPVAAADLARMVQLVDQGTISGKLAKTVFTDMVETGKGPEAIVKEKGLEQVSDSRTLDAAVDDVLSACEDQVAEFLDGKEKVFGFLVGSGDEGHPRQGQPADGQRDSPAEASGLSRTDVSSPCHSRLPLRHSRESGNPGGAGRGNTFVLPLPAPGFSRNSRLALSCSDCPSTSNTSP